MKPKAKHLRSIIIMPGILALAAFSLFLNYGKEDVKSKEVSIVGEHCLEEFDFTKYINNNNSVERKFTIRGKRMGLASKKVGVLRIAPAKETHIKDVSLVFYEDDMPVSSIIAEQATSSIPFDSKLKVKKDLPLILAGRLEFSGGIVLITEDRRTLVCDRLEWNNNRGTIFASGDCILRYGDNTVSADSIRTDVKLRDFSVSKDSKKRLKKIMEIF